MAPRYRVTLTEAERVELHEISTKGKRAARTIIYSRALLLLDAGERGPKWPVAQVAEAVGTTTRSLEKLKKRFVEDGFSAAIERKKRETPPRQVIFDGEFEARLMTLACSAAPDGRERWTIRLLAEEMMALGIVETVSPMTVCNTLKKMNLSLT